MRAAKLYWHLVTWVHPDGHGRLSVGDIVGYPERNTARYDLDAKTKDVRVKARVTCMGALPARYREQYPEEAAAVLAYWKERTMAAIAANATTQEDD